MRITTVISRGRSSRRKPSRTLRCCLWSTSRISSRWRRSLGVWRLRFPRRRARCSRRSSCSRRPASKTSGWSRSPRPRGPSRPKYRSIEVIDGFMRALMFYKLLHYNTPHEPRATPNPPHRRRSRHLRKDIDFGHQFAHSRRLPHQCARRVQTVAGPCNMPAADRKLPNLSLRDFWILPQTAADFLLLTLDLQQLPSFKHKQHPPQPVSQPTQREIRRGLSNHRRDGDCADEWGFLQPLPNRRELDFHLPLSSAIRVLDFKSKRIVLQLSVLHPECGQLGVLRDQGRTAHLPGRQRLQDNQVQLHGLPHDCQQSLRL